MSVDGILGHMRKRGSTIITLGDATALSHVSDFVSTGCPPLDLIMGGGVPVGRIVEIYGDTSVGKTLLAEHILAETQAMGGIAVLLDVESAVDLGVAEVVGVDIDNLIYATPDTVEDVFDNIRDLIVAKEEIDPEGIMTIVWDSVAATSSRAEVQKVMKEGLSTSYPPTAKEIGQMMRVMKLVVAKHNIALIILNQTREKIGVMFGDKKSTFGGRAIGYYSSVRLELAMRGKLKAKGEIIGINTRAYVAKSKVSIPFGVCNLPIVFGVGIDEAGAVLEWLKGEKIAVTRGAWSYITLASGKELRFQGAGWPAIYAEHCEPILDLLYGVDENVDEP